MSLAELVQLVFFGCVRWVFMPQQGEKDIRDNAAKYTHCSVEFVAFPQLLIP